MIDQKNKMYYLKKFPNYQFFVLVGGVHVDTHGDGIKENDRFSLFFNQNKISYFSIMQNLLVGIGDIYENIVADAVYSNFSYIILPDHPIEFNRKEFCKVYNIDEQLFFRLAKEK